MATVCATSLRFNLTDFRNFHDSLLVVLKQAVVEAIWKAKGRLDEDIIGSFQDKESDDDSNQFIHNGIIEATS